jgi:hypothetical protein
MAVSPVWRPVVGYEGFYEVSSDGQVRSLPREIKQLSRSGNLITRRVFGCVLKPPLDMDGYRHVNLLKRNYKVATIVAAAFIGPRPDGYDVCHRDGTRDNDTVGNLYYGTRSQNMQDALKHGIFILNGAKLTWDNVDDIKKRLGNGEKGRSIAKAYSVSEATISFIRSGKTWIR